MPAMSFHTITPTLDNYWRAIILFGRNVASYKFALAQVLSELATDPTELISHSSLGGLFMFLSSTATRSASKVTDGISPT